MWTSSRVPYIRYCLFYSFYFVVAEQMKSKKTKYSSWTEYISFVLCIFTCRREWHHTSPATPTPEMAQTNGEAQTCSRTWACSAIISCTTWRSHAHHIQHTVETLCIRCRMLFVISLFKLFSKAITSKTILLLAVGKMCAEANVKRAKVNLARMVGNGTVHTFYRDMCTIDPRVPGRTSEKKCMLRNGIEEDVLCDEDKRKSQDSTDLS